MAETGLFSRLNRLFSTNVIIRNTGGTQLKTIDINQIQQSGELENNAMINRFTKVYTGGSTSLIGAQNAQIFKANRPFLYSEYDQMDTDAIIASALDIIADESTLKNDLGEVLQIKSSDENIQKVLYNLFYDVLNIEFNLWPWVRNMCKYGDFFLKLEIAEEFGVYNVIPYTAYHIDRVEGYDNDKKSIVKFLFYPDGLNTGISSFASLANTSHPTFENYEMAHFRLLSDMNLIPFGRSYIEPARKLYKQYIMMEDAMLIHRIVRAPEKRIFYMNVGGIPANDVDAFMEKTVSKMKRTPYIDQNSGDYNLKYNIANMMEDYYIPVRGNDTATKIEKSEGLSYDGIQDVEYLRDKLFAALKVPKAFMGYDENTNGKATLAAQDIRFARTIERIQRIMVSELYKIAVIHLYTQGFKEESMVNFELSLTTPSIIYDQERIALLKEKVELAASIKEANLLPSDWIYENIFHMSEDMYEDARDLIIQDAKRKFRLTQIEEEGNDPQQTGKSYGTPHDLATLYGTGRYTDSRVPEGYDENAELGRPEEKASDRNTQQDNFGKDRLGVAGMKKDHDETKKSPMALESIKNLKSFTKSLYEKNVKKIILEKKENESKLLDEENINEQGF